MPAKIFKFFFGGDMAPGKRLLRLEIPIGIVFQARNFGKRLEGAFPISEFAGSGGHLKKHGGKSTIAS